MKQGHLSRYFEQVAAKRLSAVEIRPSRSNQHEFNGVQQLKEMLGKRRKPFDARFIYLGEDEDEFVNYDGWLTWYDARERHPTRTEHRLYYPSSPVTEAAHEGDLLVIGKRSDRSLLVIIAAAGSTSENQVLWLFGLELADSRRFSVVEIKDSRDAPLGLAAKFVLEQIGIQVEPEDKYLDLILGKFPKGFPTTAVFSGFARDMVTDVSPVDDPDSTLTAWMDREEVLFRTLERHLVADRISKGFGRDVDGFIQFSLSIQNRRKSRAGFALENHLEQILKAHRLRYSRGALTEGRSRPDFLFPGRREYHDPAFPRDRLRMLGAKSSCKERWTQVLREADKIKAKHLLTLEPGISESQTAEMQRSQLQLILPRSLHATYSPRQRNWLMDVSGFIAAVKLLQPRAD
ncbi:MAG: type II restriction endonuclease [Candidatus Binatus sp.]|uniref:type II restriction endonuclease n=1 Tax=Candidatus Binatus sp. TaxID=2811406 RepID=UPI003C713A06